MKNSLDEINSKLDTAEGQQQLKVYKMTGKN